MIVFTVYVVKWCEVIFVGTEPDFCALQKPANILVMGEGAERGRVKIGQ